MDIHASVARLAMLNGKVDVNSTSLTEVKVGDTALLERKWLYIVNAGTAPVYIGSQTALGTDVTMNSLGKVGIKLAAANEIWLPVSDKITVYARSNSGAGKRLRIAEFS